MHPDPVAPTFTRIDVRPATIDDIPAIAAQGEKFLRASPYSGMVIVDPVSMEQALRGLLQCGAVFVAEEAEEVGSTLLGSRQIVGGCLGVLTSMWFAPHVSVAAELAWWLEPKYRHGTTGLRLLRMFEGWGIAKGAHLITVSSLGDSDISRESQLIEAFGYKMTERAYVKEVG